MDALGPEYWFISRLKHHPDLINGTAFKPTDWGEEGVPMIRIETLTAESLSILWGIARDLLRTRLIPSATLSFFKHFNTVSSIILYAIHGRVGISQQIVNA